mmetsp:Transcript_15689/g.21169  ORF Transcript_15689/g.21169 Transcript_15689/m.21169 type:complete len:88 (+) Transcript_15689:1-264(+)
MFFFFFFRTCISMQFSVLREAEALCPMLSKAPALSTGEHNCRTRIEFEIRFMEIQTTICFHLFTSFCHLWAKTDSESGLSRPPSRPC